MSNKQTTANITNVSGDLNSPRDWIVDFVDYFIMLEEHNGEPAQTKNYSSVFKEIEHVVDKFMGGFYDPKNHPNIFTTIEKALIHSIGHPTFSIVERYRIALQLSHITFDVKEIPVSHCLIEHFVNTNVRNAIGCLTNLDKMPPSSLPLFEKFKDFVALDISGQNDIKTKTLIKSFHFYQSIKVYKENLKIGPRDLLTPILEKLLDSHRTTIIEANMFSRKNSKETDLIYHKVWYKEKGEE